MAITDNILQNVQAIFPKDKASEFVNTIERLQQRVTDFIRGSPIVSTAVVGIGTTGLIAAATTLVRRKRKKKASVRRKRSVKRRVGKKRSKASVRRVRLRNLAKARRAKRTGRKHAHRSPRHKGHKRVAFITAQGKKVSFLVGKRHKRRKR